MSKFIIFDTETTGFYEEDRIIEVGAMIIDDNDVQILDELCSTDVPIKMEATLIHKISQEMIKDKCKFTQTKFYKRLLELNNEQNYLIAHNMPFDLGMLEKEGFVNKFRIIDTLRVAKHLLVEGKSIALPYLRYSLKLYEEEEKEALKYGVVMKEHTAIGDVLVTKLLFSKLQILTKEKFPNENAIEKMLEFTKTPILQKNFKYGKYKGKKISDIYNNDIEYINWLKNNIELDMDIKYTFDTLEKKKKS
ncbi:MULTISPECIES: 3'-5' exonuclease [Arcobacteraceae]|uniref:DNA polymerase III subunit epsilon n=1 Tax=Poseidonibacter parvus TaxID=1850254 RepID=A0A1P8KKF9_9BACT|nr:MULTISPECIES: 3'-5' exonuclease [Arcobacteraceae]APW65037.1 DNA polymerase III subunit epsilon [Poseidonibacter parvus]